eukprot:CAMPEP_0201731154 /NCGR_PEP_ID=MMETSP0593-20130828/24750_1 /ASSEMBLY_ACC=CAM_ASM_000672 /TAXON_ID=267983 /ORGANISM="Skeletonema japonicum, Strain CCMP2506" /LENGTH=48 /DNA_ID= /DNA_START= /DNA_END= /DNA_ORIENTATION=
MIFTIAEEVICEQHLVNDVRCILSYAAVTGRIITVSYDCLADIAELEQ